MYGWIWRTIPGGVPGKLVGSLLLLLLVVLLLFFVIFPALEPLLPFSRRHRGQGQRPRLTA